MTDYISELISLGAPFAKATDIITDDDTKYVFIEKKKKNLTVNNSVDSYCLDTRL